MLPLVVAIIHLVGGVLAAKNNVVQNRKKSKRLIECLEAILPPLRTIEASEESKIPVAHRETLEKLKKVVEDAKVLLEKQRKKSYMSRYISSSSVKEQFNDITQRLQAHMQALNLSVATLQRVDANTMEADDAADLQEMQEELLKVMQSNQDEVRAQFADLDAAQQDRARKMLAELAELTKGQDEHWSSISQMMQDVIDTRDAIRNEGNDTRNHLTGVFLHGHDQIRRDFSAGRDQLGDMMKEGIEKLEKIFLEQSPAQPADSSLPHIEMSDLISIKGGDDDIIGNGGFGEVSKMRWMSGGRYDVAVKKLHQRRPSRKDLAEFRKEAEAMHTIRHPNVIQLYGASLKPPHVYLVLEYAPHGSLQDVLAEEGAPSGAAVWRERFFIASDIVKGLIYLHYKKVLHLDIKSGNVMICDGNSRRAAKLADFGLAYIKSEASASRSMATTTSAGTVNWKAPELFPGPDGQVGQATRASDIYSCACVMYELASGKFPWKGEPDFTIGPRLHHGNRPDKPEGCIEGFWNLIEQGWAQNAKERLPLVDALDQLEMLVEEVDSTPEPELEPEPE